MVISPPFLDEYCGIDLKMSRFSFTFSKDLYLVQDVGSLFDSEE